MSEANSLNADFCYRVCVAKDARFDGRIFVCVKTTGIYCRPVCPAPAPKKANCHFVAHAAAAEALGYRSCLRCRPETAPGTPAWSGTAATVMRALRLIEEGALDDGGVETLAQRLGLGSRQMRRLFVQHVGATPQAVAANRRLLAAKQLIAQTALPFGDIAYAAGYQSVRRFNDAVRESCGSPPTALRRGAARTDPDGAITLRLRARPPFVWSEVLSYLSYRAIPGVEEVVGQRYRRTFCLGPCVGIVAVAPSAKPNEVEVRIRAHGVIPVRQVAVRIRRLFDLDADPATIMTAFAADRVLGPRALRVTALRVPGAFDGFELAVRAVVGQQVSVKGATTLAGRVVRRCGIELSPKWHRDLQGSALSHFFPTPEALAHADLSGLGITKAREATLRALADGVLSGKVTFDPAASLEEKIRELCAVPGVGEWTAHYIALRAVGEPDAFPAADLGLRKAAGDGAPVSRRALEKMAEAWRPWRGYAALLLWTASNNTATPRSPA